MRTIIERVELDGGNIIVKLYDDGAVRVDIAGPEEIAITQAWLTGSKNKNILIERRHNKARIWQVGRESVAQDFMKPLDEHGMRPASSNPYEDGEKD